MSTRSAATLDTVIGEALYRGPVFEKLDRLRQDHPELAPELDDLARAIRQMADRVEAAIREPRAAA